MTTQRIEELAGILDDAALRVEETTMLTAQELFGIDQAYAIQHELVARRLLRGEQIIGMKMGLTSRAKMDQMGVKDPVYGFLTSGMLVENGSEIHMSSSIHPRIEPEIAFHMKDDLIGPTSAEQAFAAVGGISPALEIIDSRYKDFKFTLPDVIADNTSASYFVLGDACPVSENLGNLGIVLEINGDAVETASSAAVLENPIESIVALANLLAKHGEHIHAGHIVLSGGATAAVAVKVGDEVRGLVDEIGSVSVRFVS